MMIVNTHQLNKFAEQAGVKSRAELLPALIKAGELVSPTIAKLVTDKLCKPVFS